MAEEAVHQEEETQLLINSTDRITADEARELSDSVTNREVKQVLKACYASIRASCGRSSKRCAINVAGVTDTQREAVVKELENDCFVVEHYTYSDQREPGNTKNQLNISWK